MDVINLENVAYITEKTNLKMKQSIVKENDILLNITGASIGRSAVYKYNFIANVNQHVCIIRLKSNELADFFQFQLSSYKGQHNIMLNQAGGGREGLNFEQIGNLFFSLPNNLEEIESISHMLILLSSTIALQQRQLDLYTKLKKGLLQKLFPKDGENVPEIRFANFHDNWKQHKLGKVCTTYSGGTPKVNNRNFYNGNIPFIRSAEINKKNTELFISEMGLENSSARLIKKGDILYALYGATSGSVGISKINGAINQAILAIKPNNKYDSSFISQWLKKNKKRITKTYLQGGQGNLSASIIKELNILFPEEAEQILIGQVLQEIDISITRQHDKLKMFETLKKYLLQKLFI